MEIKYHMGCGGNYMPGYINIDFPQSQHSIVDIKADIYADLMTVNLKPCDEIRSHHVFEHFNYMKSLALLVKWTRALNIGGILRIDVPDIEELCRGLSEVENNPGKVFKFIRMIYGSHEAKWAYHINGWTESSLTYTLDRFGYKHIKTHRYGNRNHNFPNCGIDMFFEKIDTINDLKNICINIMKLYTAGQNEQKLHDYFSDTFNKLC